MSDTPTPPGHAQLVAERLDREAIWTHQWPRALELFDHIYGKSAFYTAKLDAAGFQPGRRWRRRADLERVPVTTKAELLADQAAHAPWGTVISEPPAYYTRYNQTSGTSGRPLRWIDTPESWQWSLDCWKAVYAGARVTAADRILFAFSFGPFYGFWTAFDAAVQLGAHAVPAGGLSSAQRLSLIDAVRPTVICSTPTYALRLAEVAATEHPAGWLAGRGVRVLIVAGEPGGSIPATRARIEAAWGARVIDHHGLTEVGPVSFECWEAPGFLHLNEDEFLSEILDPGTLLPVPDGQPGELVVTNLRRFACPAIRYRTGDLVRPRWPTPDAIEAGACAWVRLEGGVLGRTDDMLVVRGVNIFPGAIDDIVRSFPEVVEYRLTVATHESLDVLKLEIEDRLADPGRVAREMQVRLGLRVDVVTVSAGSLPRFEGKGRRIVDRRDTRRKEDRKEG